MVDGEIQHPIKGGRLMTYQLVQGGYIWRVKGGWDRMVWRNDVPLTLGAFTCLGRALKEGSE